MIDNLSFQRPYLCEPPKRFSARQNRLHHVLQLGLNGIYFAYIRLREGLINISPLNDYEELSYRTPIWPDAISVVDNAHRVAEALWTFPGLSGGSRRMIHEFNQLMQAAKEFRNHLQHPERFGRTDYDAPALGFISWKYHWEPIEYGKFTYRILGTTRLPGAHWEYDLLAPKLNSDGAFVPVGEISYHLGGGEKLSLCEIFLAVTSFAKTYEQILPLIRDDRLRA